MSDTPRTSRLITTIEDREGEPADWRNAPEEWVNLARGLERELATTRNNLIQRGSEIESARRELERENARLRAALYVIGYNTEPPCLDHAADIAQTTLTQSADYSSFLPNVQAQR